MLILIKAPEQFLTLQPGKRSCARYGRAWICRDAVASIFFKLNIFSGLSRDDQQSSVCVYLPPDLRKFRRANSAGTPWRAETRSRLSHAPRFSLSHGIEFSLIALKIQLCQENAITDSWKLKFIECSTVIIPIFMFSSLHSYQGDFDESWKILAYNSLLDSVSLEEILSVTSQCWNVVLDDCQRAALASI